MDFLSSRCSLVGHGSTWPSMGFDNKTSSFKVGACDANLADLTFGGGEWYLTSATIAGESVPIMVVSIFCLAKMTVRLLFCSIGERRMQRQGRSDRREDEAWFAQVCADSFQPTLAFFLRRSVDYADAEDLVQATYLAAWRRLDELRAASESQAWLYTVAFGCLQNFRRSAGRSESLVERIGSDLMTGSPGGDPVIVAEQKAEVAEMEAALATLPERDQDVLRMVA